MARGNSVNPQISLYLARLLGPVLVAAGLGMMLDQAGYLAMAGEFLKSPALVYLAAVLGLLAGVALVLAHNVWAADWRVLITLLGWISILDSATWLLSPRQAAQFYAPLLASPALPLVAGAVVALLGAVLCYFGYAAKSAGRRK